MGEAVHDGAGRSAARSPRKWQGDDKAAARARPAHIPCRPRTKEDSMNEIGDAAIIMIEVRIALWQYMIQECKICLLVTADA